MSTHTDKKKGLSQCAKLAVALRDKRWHTTTWLLKRIYGSKHLGIARLSARIYDLRRRGWIIETSHFRGTVWQHRFIERDLAW